LGVGALLRLRMIVVRAALGIISREREGEINKRGVCCHGGVIVGVLGLVRGGDLRCWRGSS